MSKFTKKERELLISELTTRLEEIELNESESAIKARNLEYGEYEDGVYSNADVKALRSGIVKLEELFEMLYE